MHTVDLVLWAGRMKSHRIKVVQFSVGPIYLKIRVKAFYAKMNTGEKN